MLKVGITGGIGSGKSTVCRLFTMLGIPVYDSDSRAKELMVSDPALMRGVKELFGAESYRSGELDRGHIAALAFADKALLERLDALVHPAVARDFEAWTAQVAGGAIPKIYTNTSVAAAAPPPYVLLESAILFESGIDRFVDRAIVVEAPPQVRLQRVVRRDNCSPENVAGRMANQIATTRMADFTVDNGGDRLLWPQVLAIDKALRESI